MDSDVPDLGDPQLISPSKAVYYSSHPFTSGILEVNFAKQACVLAMFQLFLPVDKYLRTSTHWHDRMGGFGLTIVYRSFRRNVYAGDR